MKKYPSSTSRPWDVHLCHLFFLILISCSINATEKKHLTDTEKLKNCKVKSEKIIVESFVFDSKRTYMFEYDRDANLTKIDYEIGYNTLKYKNRMLIEENRYGIFPSFTDPKSNKIKHLTRTDYVYDQSGRKTKKIEYDVNSTHGESVKKTTLFEYDEHGNIISEINKGPDDQYLGEILPPIVSFQYDDKNQLIKITKYDSNHNLKSIMEYKYNKYGNLIERIESSSEIDINDRFIFKNDKNGDPIYCEHYDSKSNLESKIYYVYGENGLILEKRELDKSGQPKEITRYEYSYYEF